MSKGNVTQKETNSQKMSIDELDTHLYDCADIIRGPIDASDYKNYIIPLVFYAAFDGRFEEKMNELADKENKDLTNERDKEFIKGLCKKEIGVIIPEDYRWDKLKNESEKLDQKLDNAFKSFQTENPDVFSDIDVSYTSESAFNGQEGSNLLKDLIDKIDEVDYENYPVDVIGEAYMNLVRKFSEQENGEYFTPETLSKLLVRVLEPYDKDNATFHDPTAGSSGLLIQAAKHVYNTDERFKEDDEFSAVTEHYNFTGQEVNPSVSRIGRMNLALHQLKSDYRQGNSLTQPQFTNNGKLTKFDYILANFPFSMSGWKANTKLRQNQYGDLNWAENGQLPHGNYGDFSFIMHMESHLADDGKMASIIPHGVLFRNGDKKYREYMIEQDIVEAVIGLPGDLFDATGIPSAILVINKNKPKERQGEVMFFNADHEGRFYEDIGSSRTKLIESGIKEIKNSINNWSEEERVCRVVKTDEITDNKYNMNIALYVDTTEPREDINVAETLADIRNLESEYNELNNQFNEYMKKLNYESGENE